MLPSDLQAVWLVRSRAVAARLRFWMLLAGLEARPRTLNDRLYLIYVLAFFSLWAFALLTLLASFATALILPLPAGPAESAAALALLALLAWTLSAAWRAARRNPIVLSEADAQLLCQTPVSRRHVALIWLFTEWPSAGLPVWAAAVVLGYTQVEVELGAAVGVEHLPLYLASGLRALSPVLPLHLGLMALVWSLGAYRLQGDRERPRLRLVPLAMGALLAASLLVASDGRPLLGLFSPSWWVTTTPLSLPLRSGLGSAPWYSGFGAALLVAVSSLLLLAFTASGLSLSRAAQETRGLEVLRHAALTGAADLAGELRQRQRLGITHPPTRLRGRSGAGALVWKRAVQVRRGLAPGSALTWLLLAGSASGLALAADPGTFVWSALAWVYLAASAGAGPLRNDLSRWALLRQVPRHSGHILAGVLALPVLLIALPSLPAALLGALASKPFWPALLLALPGASATAALASALDVLRRARASELQAGIVPGTTSLALLLGLVGAAVPVLLYLWLSPTGLLGASLSAAASALAVAFLLGWAARRYLDRVA